MATVLLSAIGAFGSAGPVGAVGATDAWPAPGHDRAGTYWNPGERRLTPDRVASLHLSHVIHTPPTKDCLVAQPPVESGGLLFGTGRNGISAYNQWTGERVWTHRLPPDLQYYSPDGLQVVGHTLVAAFSDCEVYDGDKVFFLDTATGHQVRKPWRPDSVYVVSWVVYRGRFLAFEYLDKGEQPYFAGYTLAGRRVWTVTGLAEPPLGRPIVVGHGMVYAIRYDVGAVGIGVRDGARVWGPSGYPSVDAIVALSPDREQLYGVSQGLNLVALDPLTGRESEFHSWGRGSTAMAVDSTTIYTACAGTALCATRRSDGSTRWTVEAGGVGQPVVAGGVVYYAGKVFAAATGHRIKTPIDGTVITSVSGGRAYGLTQHGVAIFR